MSHLTENMISIYKAGIEPWKVDHDTAMRDWDEFERFVASGAKLLDTLTGFLDLHHRQVASGRIPFDPEIEKGMLNAIMEVVEDSPLIFEIARDYQSRGCNVCGVEEFRQHYRSAQAILDQYADPSKTRSPGEAQAVSLDFADLQEIMALGLKPTNWCDDEDD